MGLHRPPPPNLDRPPIQLPMKHQELVLSIVRFLRRCYAEGDYQTLKGNQHPWRPTAALAKRYIVLVARPPKLEAGRCSHRNCGTGPQSWRACETVLGRKSDLERKQTYTASWPSNSLTMPRSALRTSDYQLLSELNFTEKELQLLEQLNIDICLATTRSPITVSLLIDHKRVATKDGSLVRQCESTAACLRLIRCGAIYPQVSALTGMSTQEYVYLREIAGVTNRRRVQTRTEEEEKKIHALLKNICGDRPPQMSDYLQMCDITNDKIDLGKVHHEAEISWSKD